MSQQLHDHSGLATPAPVSVRAVRVGLILSGLLVVAGLVLFYDATRFAQRERSTQTDTVTVQIEATGCTPSTVSVPAGHTTFAIRNQSDRAVEWEILDGVLVVEERENIVPGFTQTLSADLTPGTYAMTCGLLGNPRGKLIVTPSSTAQAGGPVLSLTDFIGPLSEYRVYAGTHVAQLGDAAGKLKDTLHAGDAAAAHAAWLEARAEYARIAPVAGLFADLDHRIDAPASLFAGREADSSFAGLQRIAYGLSQGQASTLQPAADALANDVSTLSSRLDDLTLQPAQLPAIAARRLQQIADSFGGDGAPRYLGDTAGVTAASVDGVAEIAKLFAPLLKNRPELAGPLSADLAAVQATLASLHAEAGHADATPLDAAARQKLASQLDQLATDFQRIGPALGLDTATFK